MAVRGTGPTQAQAPRLIPSSRGVAGQVGGLLWDAPESDPAAADDDYGEGTAGCSLRPDTAAD
jgi:hypothetical protein